LVKFIKLNLNFYLQKNGSMANSPRSSQSGSSFSMEDFEKALQAETAQFEVGQTVRGRVHSYDGDGVTVDVRGKAAAFLPIAEVGMSPIEQLSDLEEQLPIGAELEFMIIREQNQEGQITISRRRLQAQQVWDQLAELQEQGRTASVRVTGQNKGGVTVDLQGLRGFIPRSHLTQREDLDALQGQTLTVSFIEVNPETNKLVLSERLATQAASFGLLQVGQLAEGTVASLRPFGVFVELTVGVTGLLHINQVSNTYVKALDQVFKVGKPIKAVILDVDEGRKRISLSTKVLEQFPGELLEQWDEVMNNAEARLAKVQKTIAQGN